MSRGDTGSFEIVAYGAIIGHVCTRAVLAVQYKSVAAQERTSLPELGILGDVSIGDSPVREEVVARVKCNKDLLPSMLMTYRTVAARIVQFLSVISPAQSEVFFQAALKLMVVGAAASQPKTEENTVAPSDV